MSTNAVDTATTLELARGETVACVSSVEPGTGHTRYKVKGKRIEGVVTVIPAYDCDLVNPFTKRVALQLGDCADGHAGVRGRDRSHLLTVNTIELMGIGITDITHVPAADPYNVLPYDMGVGYLSRRNGVEIPDATRSGWPRCSGWSSTIGVTTPATTPYGARLRATPYAPATT